MDILNIHELLLVQKFGRQSVFANTINAHVSSIIADAHQKEFE